MTNLLTLFMVLISFGVFFYLKTPYSYNIGEEIHGWKVVDVCFSILTQISAKKLRNSPSPLTC
jgi:hypothetical protein